MCARIASQALGGYFKTQDAIRPLIYRRVAVVTQPGDYCVVDPCAGEGEAVAECVTAVFGTADTGGYAPKKGTRPDGVEVAIATVELELERQRRAQDAARRVVNYSEATVLHGDGLCCDFVGDGASLLWLNPPYDFFRGTRFELRFLRKWTPALTPGGLLVFIVPEYVVETCRSLLLEWYEDVEVLRYPEPEYSNFKQVVVLGTKRAISADAAALSLPPTTCLRDSYHDADFKPRHLPPGDLKVDVNVVDVKEILSLCPSWSLQAGYDRPAAPPQVGLAMRPKPAHVAMALGSGIFNGVRLQAQGRPDLLAKAVFVREYHDVKGETKHNEKGEVSKVVQVEKPKLTLTVMNLETGEYRALDAGTVPSDGGDGEIRNFADLLLAYGDGMVAAMRERCPALHSERDVVLPPLRRPLYPAQLDAAVAALKLMARGEMPLILGELGSGKTATTLQIIQAMSCDHVATTQQQIRSAFANLAHAAAFPPPQPLRRVRCILVVCPPHLVQNWVDEVTVCLPGVPVRELRGVGDVNAVAELEGDGLVFAVLSREAAKLGHGVEGVATIYSQSKTKLSWQHATCPRCGRVVAEAADKLASSRAVCPDELAEPLDVFARLAQAMQRLHRRGAKWGTEAFAEMRRRAAAPLLWRLKNTTTRLRESWQSKRPYSNGDAAKALAATLRLCSPDPRILRCLVASQAYGTYQDGLPWILKGFAHAVDDATLCRSLATMGQWRRRACGEPLYQAVPSPRRYPLAEYICRKHGKLFDLLVVDEFHEYANDNSAQSIAVHRLVEKIPMVLPLTGSLMNGYAKSLFRNLWSVSRRMREEFDYGDAVKFAKLYGYQKRVLTGDAARETKATVKGSVSDRVVKTEGGERTQDAPGVLPSFVLRHVLPLSVTLHKRDINPDERVVDHDRVKLEWCGGSIDEEVQRNGQRLGSKLVEAVKRNRFDEKLAGKLFGQMAELPSYYDRASADTGNAGPAGQRRYVVAYPDDVGGAVVAAADGVDASALLPKERWLQGVLRKEIEEGRNVLVFLWHKDLAARLRRLCADVVGTGEVEFLDADKVPARKRQEWIDRHVVSKRRRVLITNPSCVQTGLNNLIHFASAVFVENPGCNPFIARQAVGRLDRITQQKEVRIYWPVYPGVQAKVLDLLQTKSAISQQIDGIDPTAALEMAGGGDGEVESLDVGMAIYRYLGGD